MNQENMRIGLSCTDQDTIWVIDEIIYGLYSINKITFEVKCVIDSWELFRYDNFRPHGIFKWKEDYIVVIPLELDKNWVIYNKITGQVEYKKVMEIKCQGTFIGIDEATDQAYFCPVTKKDPIVIVNLKKFICVQTIKVFGSDLSDSNNTMAWRGTSSKDHIFFPVRGEKTIVRMSYCSNQVKFLESDIIEGIADIDFYLGELWALPMNGEKIYKISDDGKIVASVELIINRQTIPVSEFARIVVVENYIFLLSYHQCGIYVYNKINKKIFKIAEENDTLPDTYKTKDMRYWGYYFNNNKICFLPLRNKYLQIDLNKLTYEQKDLCYPNECKENENNFYCIWNHIVEFNDCMVEMDSYSQMSFFKYIKRKTSKKAMKTISDFCGKNIWSNLRHKEKM